jgi:ATP-dependent DNA helicase RecG
MILSEIKEIIDFLKDVNSDTTHVEVKSCKGGFPKRLWETLSAFANTQNGGVIILGISETAEGIQVTGVDNSGKLQKDLGEICAKMVPPLRPLIEVHRYEGKMLVTAEIPEVSFKDKPCYYQGSGIMSGAFIRVSDGDRQLTPHNNQ